jgi:hypothetical protein
MTYSVHLKREKKNFIAHRGLMFGPDKQLENHPDTILYALIEGFGVEFDLNYVDGAWVLGHDKPQYQVPFSFIQNLVYEGGDQHGYPRTRLNFHRVFIHLKDLKTVEAFHSLIAEEMASNLSPNARYQYNWFYHERDQMTITSGGVPWVHPHVNYVPSGSAWVVPTELQNPTGMKSPFWGKPEYYCVDHTYTLWEHANGKTPF